MDIEIIEKEQRRKKDRTDRQTYVPKERDVRLITKQLTVRNLQMVHEIISMVSQNGALSNFFLFILLKLKFFG